MYLCKFLLILSDRLTVLIENETPRRRGALVKSSYENLIRHDEDWSLI